MNILSRMNTFFHKHGSAGLDFVKDNPEATGAGVGLGVFAASTALGHHIGKNYGIDHFGPSEEMDVQRTYFVKTGTESYTTTCRGTTSSGESFSFLCTQVRDTGYNETVTEQVNARQHYAMMGLGIGALAGAVGGVAAGVGTHMLLESLN